MTDMLFRRPLDAGHPVDLTFGEPLGPVRDAAGHLEIVLPAIAPNFVGRLEYDNAVSRSDVIGSAGGWRSAARMPAATVVVPHEVARPVSNARIVLWSRGTARTAASAIRWRVTRPVPAAWHLRWHAARPAAPDLIANHWQHGLRTPHVAAGRWQEAIQTRASGSGGWQPAVIIRPSPRRIRWGLAGPVQRHIGMSASLAAPTLTEPVRIPWQRSAHLTAGRSTWTITPPPDPWRCYTPPQGGAVHLLFDSRLGSSGLDILFSCGSGPVPGQLVVPTLRYYIVINSATLTRVSNNLPIPVFGLTVSIDADSAHWTWSASVPLRSLSDLEPDAPSEAVELRAEINGETWNLLLLSVRESERFGASSLQIGGRGIAAELSAPIFPALTHRNDFDATAQQLAAAALTVNGVSIGWTLDWLCADWPVPAGVWLHNGTPLDAVARIAEAAGAYVQAHPSARTLRVLPRYPLAPWNWTTAAADIVLPAAAVLERGTEHVTRAGYNVVYVSGEAGGVLGRVWRDGTAADQPAQMITDALITHADAARGRGLAVLGNTGAQQIITLETGVLPAGGVFHVGKMLDWTRDAASRRGIVRSLSVGASVPSGTSKAPVVVRQTVEVETHG